MFAFLSISAFATRLPHSCTADMSPKIIGDTNFAKLNKCVTLWTEDAAIQADNRVLMAHKLIWIYGTIGAYCSCFIRWGCLRCRVFSHLLGHGMRRKKWYSVCYNYTYMSISAKQASFIALHLAPIIHESATSWPTNMIIHFGGPTWVILSRFYQYFSLFFEGHCCAWQYKSSLLSLLLIGLLFQSSAARSGVSGPKFCDILFNIISLCIIWVYNFFLPETVASSAFDTMLISVIPSSPIIFSKPMYPWPSLLTFSISIPRFVPLELDLRIMPQNGARVSDMVMCRIRDLVLN